MSKRARDQSTFRTNTELLSALEGMRVISLPEAARLNDLSVDTLRRRYGHLILKLSDKRVGMRLRDALSLAQPIDAA